MNWKQLKDFCNGLTEEQLQEKVIMWREHEAVNNIEVDTLQEDHYIDETGQYDEGCFEKSTALNLIKDNTEDYPNGLKHFKKVYDKGFPILWENF